MGRWGDGEMGKWGDGEMGRWGDGAAEINRRVGSAYQPDGKLGESLWCTAHPTSVASCLLP
ncbi:MAG: hypothetical protein F6K26_50080, partial [Moorea sp. SIO2I5]|nr:hypothetical protein [Moorena sp. SIO2I5]